MATVVIARNNGREGYILPPVDVHLIRGDVRLGGKGDLSPAWSFKEGASGIPRSKTSFGLSRPWEAVYTVVCIDGHRQVEENVRQAGRGYSQDSVSPS